MPRLIFFVFAGDGAVMTGPTEGGLVFHTLFGEEFRGASAAEVVQALYRNSKTGMENITFEAWWSYQQSVWKARYRLELPSSDAPEACQALLDIMARVGALECGPLSKK